MANLANLARMFTESLGQGDVVVTDVVPGFVAFDDVLTDGLIYSYGIEGNYVLFDGVPIPQSREVGRAPWDQASQTIQRSSATNVRSTEGAGTKFDLAGDSEIYICAIEEDFVSLGGGTYQIKTTAGGVTVAVRDTLILVNKTVGQATAVTLPASSTKVGPVIVKDLKGDAETNNITVDVDGGGTIDGAASKILRSNYECRRFDPIPDNSGYFISI